MVTYEENSHACYCTIEQWYSSITVYVFKGKCFRRNSSQISTQSYQSWWQAQSRTKKCGGTATQQCLLLLKGPTRTVYHDLLENRRKVEVPARFVRWMRWPLIHYPILYPFLAAYLPSENSDLKDGQRICKRTDVVNANGQQLLLSIT